MNNHWIIVMKIRVKIHHGGLTEFQKELEKKIDDLFIINEEYWIWDYVYQFR